MSCKDNEKNLCQQEQDQRHQLTTTTIPINTEEATVATTTAIETKPRANNVSTTLDTQTNPMMISNEIANIANIINEKKKLVRRAFSMPRNLFRLSCRFKNPNKTVAPKIHANDLQISPKTIKSKTTTTTTTTTTASSSPAPNTASSCNQSVQTNVDENLSNEFMDNKIIIKSTPSASINENDNNNMKNAVPGPKSISLKSCTGKHQRDQNGHRLFRRSAWKKFITRISQQISLNNTGAKQAANLTDARVPPINRHARPPDRVPGVVGLQNHGNTCFMNAVLQCLSHTDILAEYFVLDQYKTDLKRRNKINSRKFGTRGELTEQLALVLKALWSCKNESDYSTSFKAVVDRYGTQFRSSTQHDAQEFLFWLLDKVHEDLNTASKRKYKPIKNSYERPDEVIAAETLANHIRCNNSFVQAVFQAQFRSSLSCPRCHKQSNTFDPFHCISVQLPQTAQQNVFVTVLYDKQHPRQVKLGLSVPLGSPIIALREQLQADTGIPLDRMILTEIQESGFARVFCDSQPISMLSTDNFIYCIETTVNDDTQIKSTINDNTTCKLTLLIANVKRLSSKDNDVQRFSTPFCVQVNRDISYIELQKTLLKEMRANLKSNVFTYSISTLDMFKIRLQDPSADPDTYVMPNVEHPLFTEMIDSALSVLPVDAGPQHVKFLLEWQKPDEFFSDMSDPFVEHESVSQLKNKIKGDTALTLEQCLEHYTKAETLSAEDAWRCPNCQKYLPVVKTLGLWSLPDILVIHFKRFRQQHTKGPQSAKLTTTVTFPLTDFDMSPHLARNTSNSNNVNRFMAEDNWSPWRKLKRKDLNCDVKNNRYDLYAVCYHQGDTLETGHYTAACKNPYDHQWYKFDDQNVNIVAADQVQDQIVNNEAYILFYQRHRTDSSESSASNSSVSEHWLSKIPIINESSSTTATETNQNQTAIENTKNTAEPSTILLSNKEIQTDDCFTNLEPLSSPKLTTDITTETITEIKIETDVIPEKSISNGLGSNGSINIDITGNLFDVIEEGLTMKPATKPIAIGSVENDSELSVELRNVSTKKTEASLSMSFPIQRSLWPSENHHNIIHTYTPILSRGSFNLNDMLSNNLQSEPNVTRPFSTSLIQHRNSTLDKTKISSSDAVAMVRGISSCSKDTLIFIDSQKRHRSLIDEEKSYMPSQPLWISPVTPHKLITVSPKN